MYNKNGSSPDKILYYTKQVFSKRGNHFILLSRTYAWDSSSGARVCVCVCVNISWETASVFGGGIDCKPSPGTPVYTIGGC